MSSSRNSLEQILVLAGVYLKSDKTVKAQRLLDKAKPKFVREQAKDIWSFWHAQVLIAQGKADIALREAKEEKELSVRRKIETIALRALAHDSGEWEPFIEHLEICFQEAKSGVSLLELCDIKARQQEWAYIADLADSLLLCVGTADALRRAAVGAWHAGRFQQCLELLKENGHLFPLRILSDDLRRLQAQCQARLGFLSQAVSSAEDLVQQDDSVENVLFLLELQLQKGDLKGLAINARKLTKYPGVDAMPLLRIARVVLFEDPELAKHFWFSTREEALSDPDLLNEAVSLGYALSLDTEMAPMIRRMREFAAQGRGAFRAFDTKELLSLMQQRAGEVSEAELKYRSGEVPIHLVTERFQVPLSSIFHRTPEQNRKRPDPRSQPIIWARHGGRPLQKQLISSYDKWRLHVDITAILLATDLGILEKIEHRFSPLLIPPGLPTTLVHQRDLLSPIQPSRLSDYRSIQKLVRDGELKPLPSINSSTPVETKELLEHLGADWVETLEIARKEDGLIIDFFPLMSGKNIDPEPITLPEQYHKHVANCGALIQGLRQNGSLSETAYASALLKLGKEGDLSVSPEAPVPGSKVFLVKNIASVLEEANLLEKICRSFETFIDPAFLDETHREVEEDKIRYELRMWLSQLIDRIQVGLDKGTYECIVAPDAPESLNNHSGEKTRDDLREILIFLQFQSRENDVIWVDDRWMNSYSQRDGIPIIGINEVLSALLSCDAINEHEYYEKILKLRASNIRYIPLEGDEICYHLRQAVVEKNIILETEELSVIRRYIAACLLDGTNLQRPPMPQGAANQYGEIAFVISTQRAIIDAILAGWLDEKTSNEIASARADWILENLYTGTFGVRHLQQDPDPNSVGLDLIGLDIGGALARGIGINRQEGREGEDREVSKRQQFFNWLESRIISFRVKADPNALVAAADTLRKILVGFAEENFKDEALGDGKRFLLLRFFLDLPKNVQTGLQLEPEILSRLGLSNPATVVVGPLSFMWDEFLEAAANAANGRDAHLHAQGAEKIFELEVKRAEAKQPVIEIKDEKGEIAQTFGNLMVDLLLDDPKVWEEELISKRPWFDCHTETFKELSTDIAATKNPHDRIDKAHDWLESSTAVFYGRLEQSLRDTQKIQQDDFLPPSAIGLLRHFRLDKFGDRNVNFSDAWQEAAIVLNGEEGLESAIERVSCLPVKLPKILFKEFDKLSKDDKRSLYGRLLKRCTSPVCMLHLFDLALRYIGEDRIFFEAARSLVAYVFDKTEGTENFRLFDVLLKLVNDEFWYWAETKEWPAALKLAAVWGHTSRLHNIFIMAQADPNGLAQLLETKPRQLSVEMLGRDPAFWNDILHPRRLKELSFMVHGVAAIAAAYDLEIAEELNIKDLILAKGFTQANENWIPQIELLQDSSLAGNELGSFLGGDRDQPLALFLEEEQVSMLSFSGLQALVKDAICKLREEQGLSFQWAIIATILEGLPVYRKLEAEFEDLINSIDWESLSSTDPSTAYLALNILADQIIDLANEKLRSQGREDLLTVVRTQANDNGQEERNTKDELSLLDSTLKLSIFPGNQRASSESFAKLVEEIVTIQPNLAGTFRRALWKLARELPVSQLHGLWPAILLLRTYENQSQVRR